MKRPGITLITMFTALLALAAFATFAAAGKKTFDAISTGTMESGDVVLELEPAMKGNGRLVVKFSANTHTVDLSQFDLKVITTLQFDGKEIKPSKSDGLRGHHAFGKIVFDVGEEPKSFKITVVGIPAIEERVYEWRTE